ncbi:hypothetical protein B566_EDAN015539 [Ephemera danica]|nr:hypothetical protein B566_EDAN015539 [Ephemera danica]
MSSIHHVVTSARSKSVVEAPTGFHSSGHGIAEDIHASRRRATYVCSHQASSSQSQASSGSSSRQQSIQEVEKPSLVTGKVSSAGQVVRLSILIHVLLLGDSGVGKTCLLVRFRDGRFLYGSYISTVGVDFRSKVVTVDEAKVKLQIWDTAGQERFRSVTHAYYRDAHALLLLYDVTNKTSFDNIRAWLGNKADCGSEREIRREDGERLAREYNVIFLETSAKTGLNVELAFSAVARELLSRSNAEGTTGNGTTNGQSHDAPFSVQDYIREHSQRIGASTGSSACAQCNTA